MLYIDEHVLVRVVQQTTVPMLLSSTQSTGRPQLLSIVNPPPLRYLPPKVEWVVFCTPSSSQGEAYEEVSRLINRTVADTPDHLSAIMLLRKLSNHPALLGRGKACVLTFVSINVLHIYLHVIRPSGAIG